MILGIEFLNQMSNRLLQSYGVNVINIYYGGDYFKVYAIEKIISGCIWIKDLVREKERQWKN